MNLIKTSLGIGKKISYVHRLKEILLVFAKHGFSEFFSRSILAHVPDLVLPSKKVALKAQLKQKGKEAWGTILGHRLKLSFEELGPSFIKFGQLLASRNDIFDEGFIEEMKSLQDAVRPIDFNEALKEIEDSIGKKIGDVFQNIHPKPLGTASIGVVYEAKLIDGQDVVIKVRRPGIEKNIAIDFDLLTIIFQNMEELSEEIKYLNLSKAVNDFRYFLFQELNFFVESNNCQKMAKVIENYDKEGIFIVPHVYKEISTDRILVLEKINGLKITQFTGQAWRVNNSSNQEKQNLHKLLQSGVKQFLHSFLKDGFFHADLHGGNILYIPSETESDKAKFPNGRLGLLDFGLMGHLSRKNRETFLGIIYGILSHDFEKLIYEFLDVAEYENLPDVSLLISDVRMNLGPYVGLTSKQTNISLILQVILKTLSEHRVYLPREWFIVFRGIFAIDGVAKGLDFDMDVYDFLQQDIENLIQNSFGKKEIMEEGLWVIRDLLDFLRLFPKQFRWAIKDLEKNQFRFKLDLGDYAKAHNRIAYIFERFYDFSRASLFLFLGFYVMNISHDFTRFQFLEIPWLSWTCWGIFLYYFFIKKNKN